MTINPVWIVDKGTPTNLLGCEESLFGESNTPQERKSNPGWTSRIFGAQTTRKTRSVTLPTFEKTRVVVVAPGAGVGSNGKVYMSFKQDPRLQLRLAGRSGMPYDRYPPMWPQGGPAPNLATFAQGMLSEGLLGSTDCLILGSRGGQVVLPSLWNALGDSAPPAIVINGGCAMDLPFKFNWPGKAVTLLVLGGRDYFKPVNVAPHQYLSYSQRYVPTSNSSTAILYVQEMEHMPSQPVLAAVLNHAIAALVSWRRHGQVPLGAFETILRSVKSLGMTARLTYISAGAWQEVGDNSPLPSRGTAPLQSPFSTPSLLQSPFSTPVMNSPFCLPPTEQGYPSRVDAPAVAPPQGGSEMAKRAMAYAPFPDAPPQMQSPQLQHRASQMHSPRPQHCASLQKHSPQLQHRASLQKHSPQLQHSQSLQMRSAPAAASPAIGQPRAQIMLPTGAIRHYKR